MECAEKISSLHTIHRCQEFKQVYQQSLSRNIEDGDSAESHRKPAYCVVMIGKSSVHVSVFA